MRRLFVGLVALVVGFALCMLANLLAWFRGFLPWVLAWYAGWRLLEFWFR